MKTFILALAVTAFTWTGASAEEGKKPSAEETKSILSALAQLGCAGGESVKEPSGLFEIDDAQCKIGNTAPALFFFKPRRGASILLNERLSVAKGLLNPTMLR